MSQIFVLKSLFVWSQFVPSIKFRKPKFFTSIFAEVLQVFLPHILRFWPNLLPRKESFLVTLSYFINNNFTVHCFPDSRLGSDFRFASLGSFTWPSNEHCECFEQLTIFAKKALSYLCLEIRKRVRFNGRLIQTNKPPRLKQTFLCFSSFTHYLHI